VKAEIGKPRAMVPDEGYLEFFVDWWEFKDEHIKQITSSSSKTFKEPFQIIKKNKTWST